MRYAKYRRRVFGQIAGQLGELMRQKTDACGREVITLEVVRDHVPLFVKQAPKPSASYGASQFMGFASCVPREGFPSPTSWMATLWSLSYFAASVGTASAGVVEKYIDTQGERPREEGDSS